MFSVLTNQHDRDGRMECLYTIIYKLKERGIELRNELDKRTQPESELSDVVNNMTRKLVEKQCEIDKIKEECKVLKLEVKDLKKVKVDSEKEAKRIDNFFLSLPFSLKS